MPAASCCTTAGCTFTIENAMLDMSETTARKSAAPLPRTETPIVPKNSISGRALVAVIAIMTFLASFTTGAVMLVRAMATEWQSDVAREVTIQLRAAPGRDVEADVRRAAEIARSFPGIAEVRPYSREESLHLLEPWLGSGLSVDDLPVPRLIVVRIAPSATPDLAQLRRLLAERVAGANLDDHRAWIDRMRAMARMIMAGGAMVLVLVFAVTILSVTFATRGAMAMNRPVIEVLHFVGAKDSFIAGQFLRHFLALGLKGGLIGGGAAAVLFAATEALSGWLLGGPGGDLVTAMFGRFSIGPEGYLAMLAQIILLAAVTGVTSHYTVNRTLGNIE
jgi:cell division transport system permease protein